MKDFKQFAENYQTLTQLGLKKQFKTYMILFCMYLLYIITELKF